MKPEQERVHNVLLDTITLLCKNSLPFSSNLRIEGVIGITADGSDIFLVHLNETICNDEVPLIPQHVKPETCDEMNQCVRSLSTFPRKTSRKQARSSYQSGLPVGQQPAPKIVKDAISTNCGRQVLKRLTKSTESYGRPSMRGIRSTKTAYGLEGSTSIASTTVTESFIMDVGDTSECNNAYAVDNELIYDQQKQYQAVHEPEHNDWNNEYHSYDVHQQTFHTPSKAVVGTRRKQVSNDNIKYIEEL